MYSKLEIELSEDSLREHVLNAEKYVSDKVSANKNTYFAADLKRSSYTQKRLLISRLVGVIRNTASFSKSQWQVIYDLIAAAAVFDQDLNSSIIAHLERSPVHGIPEIIKCLHVLEASLPPDIFETLKTDYGPEIAIDLAILTFRRGSGKWAKFFESLTSGDFGRFTVSVIMARYSLLVKEIEVLELMRYLKEASNLVDNPSVVEAFQYVAKRAGIEFETGGSPRQRPRIIIAEARMDKIRRGSRSIGKIQEMSRRKTFV